MLVGSADEPVRGSRGGGRIIRWWGV